MPWPIMLVEIEPIKITLPKIVRTSGVHLSHILRGIAVETGILKLEILEELNLVGDVREITDPVALIRISIGLAWEQYYIPQLTEVLDHPDEMYIDGVYMNPDGESISFLVSPFSDLKGLLKHVVHEIKATYKSTKTVGEDAEAFVKNWKKNWMWLAQLMAYCRAKKTLHGWLHVLFLCGNYRFPITPQLRVYKITFTQEELDENWELLTDYRDERMGI